MPQDVVIYGTFLCSFCGQGMRTFTADDGTRTLKCKNPNCSNLDVAYHPPTVTITEA